MKVFHRLEREIPLSPEELQLLASVQKLAREKIAPRSKQHDRDSSFPWDNVHDMNALGLNAMMFPEDCGGSALSYTAYLACVREISKACASTGIIWATVSHGMKPVVDFGTPEQKRRLLPRIAAGGLASLAITEASAGSDATGMTTTFTPEGGSIRIDGRKLFITSGDAADLILLFGKWSELGNGKEAISVAVLEKETPGFQVLGLEQKMGHRASSTAALAFDGCRIPRDNLLGAPGQGLKILLASLNKSRASIAAHALGIARAAFEDMVDYINERRQSGKRIVEFQGIQFMLAELATDLAFCESWLWRLGRMIDDGDTDFGVDVSMLKMRASDLAMRISTEAVQMHGGYGYCQDFRVERLMRDAKITQIWEGTNQVHRQLIGRSFLKK